MSPMPVPDDRIFAFPPDDEPEAYHSSYALNPYSNPQTCGLEIIADMDDPNSSYDFEMLVIWRDIATGIFYMGADSGCSCPSPYENVHKLSDLERLTSYAQIEDAVKWEPSYEGAERRWPIECVERFLATARAAIGRKLPKRTPA